MSKRARLQETPLAALFALICVSALHAQTASPTPAGQLSLEEALRLANTQVTTVQTAVLNERIATEDVRQAQAGFLPKISTPLSYIYTSPALGLPPGEPRAPRFVSADGIGVTDALVNVAGDFDITGWLRATLARNRALLVAPMQALKLRNARWSWL